MEDELFRSAGRWARSGMDAYIQPQPSNDLTIHHTVVGLEHLAKAYLYSIHPALIAAKDDVDGLLHLVGQGKHASKPPSRIRTIGLVDVNQRVRRILRADYPYDNRGAEDPVVVARNGIAHAGLWDPADLRSVLALAIRRIDAILEALSRNRSLFWRQYEDVKTEIVRGEIADVSVRVTARIENASVA